jgi:hypothetical protein
MVILIYSLAEFSINKLGDVSSWELQEKLYLGSNYLAIEFLSDFISLCEVIKGHARPAKMFMLDYSGIAGMSVDACPFYLLISGSLACNFFPVHKRDFSEICILYILAKTEQAYT